MSKITKGALALAAMLAMMAAESPRCSSPRDVDTDRPPADRQVDPRRERTVLIVAGGDAPFTIYVVARGPGGRETTGPEPVAGGQYKQTLSYTSGLRIIITVTVFGPPQEPYYCSISDGPDIVRAAERGAVTCTLRTSR